MTDHFANYRYRWNLALTVANGCTDSTGQLLNWNYYLLTFLLLVCSVPDLFNNYFELDVQFQIYYFDCDVQ